MRVTLFLRLFVMQLVAAIALVAGAIGVLGLLTGQNFASYLRSRDTEAFRELAEEIGERFEASGDLSGAAAGTRALRATRREPLPGAGHRRAPGDGAARDRDRRHPGGGRREPPLPPAFLLDAAGEPVGRVPRDLGALERAPIEAGGRTVGYLAWPRFGPPQPPALAFANRQWRAYVLIGFAAVGLAAGLAALMARRTTRPIRALSAASAALARRDFAARVPAQGSDEIGQLGRDFNRLAEALQGYDQRQRQWLADVAHELRNPLAVLKAQLEAMRDGVRAPDARALRGLGEEVTRLEAVVDQLHLLSLAESGGLRLQCAPLDLTDLARSAAARYAQRFAAAGFELRCEAGAEACEIVADRRLVEAVVANLLENALRYAAPPGPVVLRVTAGLRGAVLAIADAGPGVPDEALPRLFDRLYRVDEARAAGGGAGLGLAIVRSIVEAHGGVARALRSAAGGLEVRCEWPQAPPP